jgi:long-chain fatty acid transport protein
MTPNFSRIFLKVSVSALALSVMAGSAVAGGYSRGSANFDPLFDEGTSVTSSFAVTAPNRGIDSFDPAGATPLTNASATITPDGNVGNVFSENYVNFGATVATDIYAGARCAGSLAQPFGAKADYGFSRLSIGYSSTTSSEMNTTEFGLTCSYGFAAGPGKLHVFGGVFYQDFNYDEARAFGYGSLAAGAPGADLSMKDGSVGYRMGVGYTIPEFAIKGSLAYRSAVDHHAEGTLRRSLDLDPGPGFNLLPLFIPIYADASTPQSVKLSLQSGIAEGWLAFGSVEWTDWSVLQQVQVYTSAAGIWGEANAPCFRRHG